MGAIGGVISDIMVLVQSIKTELVHVVWILLFLWVIQLFNASSGNLLCVFGISPRRPFGLVGIVMAPFLHAGFNHLFFNSVPLFLLLTALLATGLTKTICITVSVMIISGFAVWLFGRTAIHVGASGLIMGYMGYILVDAYHNPNVNSVIIGVVSFYYLGSVLFSVIPDSASESWEGHVFGFFAGVFVAYVGCIEPFATMSLNISRLIA